MYFQDTGEFELECYEQNTANPERTELWPNRNFRVRFYEEPREQVPIQRTKHAAIPIQTPFGDHCILAADALFEILNRLIFCHRIFQKFQESTWPVLSAHLAQLSEFFSTNELQLFLHTTDETESFRIFRAHISNGRKWK
ncbi:Protein CBG25603 [Caenorhabditis briggsae]|uniref:Protein CBG25603 n=1 Tax=Caenorhabditis briggsae TaxID=6238 RepID=B6IF87_CAEBR|nr:Protein CBG25603 [Caenorhabditis briggsae]CAR98567.1 Protein CBG25603 [Caenorhabditis briggsae]